MGKLSYSAGLPDEQRIDAEAVADNPQMLTQHDALHIQIEDAFRTSPDVAGTLHGIRKIHQGARGRRTSLFPSKKAGGAIPIESRLELAHALALERSPNVRNYRTQAICIRLPNDVRAFPDFLIQTTSGAYELHEIKPSLIHLSMEALHRFDCAKKLVQPLGIEYRFVDANQILEQKSFEWLMARYARGNSAHWTDFQINLASDLIRAKCTSLSQAYICLQSNGFPVALADYIAFHEGWFMVEDSNG